MLSKPDYLFALCGESFKSVRFSRFNRFISLSYLIFIFFFTSITNVLNAQNNLMTKPVSYIFTPEILQQNQEDLSAIYNCMAKYYEGVERAKSELLDEVFFEDWLMKDTDSPHAVHLNVEDKATFIKRVKDHGPYPGYAQERVIADIRLSYEKLAFIRVNKDPSRSSTSFFLFKVNGEWKIMDKIWLNTRKENSHYIPSKNSYATVESLIDNYFKALSNGDYVKLSDLLHQNWDLKYIDESNQLVIEKKEDFINRLSANSIEDHIDYSQLLSIDVYHDGLAVVRIDRPSQGETIYLTIFKVGGDAWKIVNERRAMQ